MMKKQAAAIVVAAVTAICAQGAGTNIWQPPVFTGGVSQARSTPIIDFGGDYSRHNIGQFLLRDSIFLESNVDVDGDGLFDDSISYVPFQLDDYQPVPDLRYTPWDAECVNGKIYMARRMEMADHVGNVITEGGGPNPNHSVGADDINLMSWSSANPGALLRGWSLWLWKKEDFLGGGDSSRVGFDAQSRFALQVTRYWQNIEGSRFVVLEADGLGGEQWYISEYTGFGGFGTVHVLQPTETRWAKYYPQAPHDIQFHSDTAQWTNIVFQDIQVVGFYTFTDNFVVDLLGAKIGAFEVNAAVQRPDPEMSPSLAMSQISGVSNIPPFMISQCEVPYALYADIHKRYGQNMYALQTEVGFEFEKEPKIGSMLREDNLQHDQNEPVSGIQFLDTAAWCNALSISDGYEPVYYADPGFSNVFKRVVERQLDPATFTPEVYVKWAANGYRLPTPAEWQSAAGDLQSQMSGFITNGTTLPVGSSGTTNAAGLYDLIGNVWEYVWDAGNVYSPTSAVFKTNHTVLGGDILYPESPQLHPASPYGDTPWADGAWNIGFRVVRRNADLATPDLADISGGNIPSWTFSTDEVVGGDTNAVAGALNLEMAFMPHTNFTYPTVRDETMDMTVSEYLMAKTETSYAQWREVWHWAKAHGYRFNYDGDMGSTRHLIGQTLHTPNEPVTMLFWYDMVAWCNALSEMEGRRPIYYADEGRSNVYRQASMMRPPMVQTDYLTTTNEAKYTASDVVRGATYTGYYYRGDGDVYHDWSGNGYRLPTAMERNVALGSFDFQNAASYAWLLTNSGLKTQPCGTLAANENGIYDLMGNVFEYTGHDARLHFTEQTNPKGLATLGADVMAAPWVIGCSALSKIDKWAGIKGHFLSPAWDLGFRVVRCDDIPHLTVNGTNYTLVGSLATEMKTLIGQNIIVEGVPSGRFFDVTNYTLIATGSTVNLGPTHPLDGDPLATFDFMDVDIGQQPEALQGATYRANNNHDGYFNVAGGANFEGLKWKFQTGDRVSCSPVAVDGVVYVGSLDKNFYAVDETTGMELWRFVTDGQIYGSPTVYDGIIYFGSNDGNLYAITTNGALVWKVLGEPLYLNIEWTQQVSTQQGTQPDVAGAPVVAHGLVFAKVNRRMRGYDLKTGEEKWVNIAEEGVGTQQTGTLTIWGGAAHYGYYHAGFGGFYLRTLGKVPGSWGGLGNSTERSTPAIYGTNLYHLGIFGNLHCDDVATGTALYMSLAGSSLGRTDPGNLDSGAGRFATYTSPSVAEGVAVFCTYGGYVSGMDAATGEELWLTDLGSNVVLRAPTSIANGYVYFGAMDGTVYSMDLHSGEVIGTYQTGGGIAESPYLGTDVLYVGSEDGYLYALKPGPRFVASTNLLVSEGSTADLSISLSLEPDAATTVTVSRVSGSDTNLSVQSSSVLVFTTNNWMTPQSVTIQATEDDDWINGSAIFRFSSSSMTDFDITATEVENEVDPTYILPWSESFENNATNAGTLGALNGQYGWIAEAGAVVINSDAQSGSQSLSISNAQVSHSFSGASDNIRAEFWAKPVREMKPGAFDGSASAVFYVNTNDNLVVYSNTTAITLSDTTVSNGWNKFGVECDYFSKVWKLELNDILVASNLSFYTAPASFSSFEVLNLAFTNGLVSFLDLITVSDLSDIDGDGLPDSWERTHYGDISPSPTDMASNGVNTVMQAYIAGLAPTDPDARFVVSDLQNNVLFWNGVSGRVYTVYWTSNLLENFQTLETNVSWVPGIFTDTTHIAEEQGFYKIDIQLEKE